MESQTIKSIKVKGTKATVVIEVDTSKLLERELIDSYDFQKVNAEIIRLVAEEIMRTKGKEFVKKVTLGVNWAEIVRADIAQKLIKAIASGQFEERRY